MKQRSLLWVWVVMVTAVVAWSPKVAAGNQDLLEYKRAEWDMTMGHGDDDDDDDGDRGRFGARIAGAYLGEVALPNGVIVLRFTLVVNADGTWSSSDDSDQEPGLRCSIR